jgi:CRISPR-associated Csh1 family protein
LTELIIKLATENEKQMIKSLYTFGKSLSQNPNFEEYFEPWENPFPKADEASVVYAQIVGGVLQNELAVTDFKTANIGKYLYRRVQGANGTNLVPTFYLIVPAKESEKENSIRKLIKKISASVKNYKHKFLEETQIAQIEKMLIERKLTPKQNYLFTVKIDGKFFGEYEEYRQLFYNDAYQKYKKDSSAIDKVCAVTYQPVKEVWGRIDTLGFTVNDLAFSRNGFDVSQSFKMFPVSPDAVKVLEGAKRIAFNKLSYGFYGMSYFVIPRFVGTDEKTVDRVSKRYISSFNEDADTLDTQTASIIHNERIIQKIIDSSELSDNSIYYDIFFYQKNNAQLLLKLHLSDLLPSRFREIFNAKRQVEAFYYPITTARIPAKGKQPEKVIDYRLTFALLKDYFSKRLEGKNETIFHPYFFKIVEAVFYRNPLNYAQILNSFYDSVKIAFKASCNYEKRFELFKEVKQTFLWLQYFSKLQLFDNQNLINMDSNTQIDLTLEGFEQQHPNFFDESSAKKAAFYLGCLTELLLWEQRRKLGSEPFKKYLNGLSLGVSDLRKIYPKLINKMDQYEEELKPKREAISRLKALFASAILDANPNERKPEVSFSYALGLTMQNEFTKAAIAKAGAIRAAQQATTENQNQD